MIGVLFLELRGFDFKASEADATLALMALAAGTLDEGGYAAWLRANAKGKRSAEPLEKAFQVSRPVQNPQDQHGVALDAVKDKVSREP